MKITILAFGVASEICGAKSFSMEVKEQLTAHELKKILVEKYSGLSGIIHFDLAINRIYRDNDYLISSNDEIAIIPPVSGG